MQIVNQMLTSWRLGWSGLRVILSDKTLLAFPAVTVAAIIAILSLIYIVIGPNLQLLILAMLPNIGMPNNSTLFYTLLILWYFFLAFTAVFMHVALIGAVHISMNQRDSKFLDGIGIAARLLPSIMAWTLISYTFGFIATLLDQSRYTSRFVRRVFGAAWSVLTFLVVPVMVVEDKNIFKGLAQSNRMMEAKWGNNLHQSFSLGYFFALLNIPTLIYMVFAYFQPVESHTALELIGTLYFLFTLVAIQASRSVLMVALYQYAATGQVAPRFDEAFLSHAFVPWEAVATAAEVLSPSAPKDGEIGKSA